MSYENFTGKFNTLFQCVNTIYNKYTSKYNTYYYIHTMRLISFENRMKHLILTSANNTKNAIIPKKIQPFQLFVP